MIKLHIFNSLPKAFLCETGMFTFWKWVMVKNENLGALSWFVLRSISLSHDCFCMIGTNLNTVKYHCFDLKMHWKDLRVSSGDHRPHLKKIHIRRIFTFALFLLLYFEPQVHLGSLKLSVLFSCYVTLDSFVTPQTIACQALLSTEFSRQEYWSGLPLPFPGDLPDPGIEYMSSALAGGFITTEPPGKPLRNLIHILQYKFTKYLVMRHLLWHIWYHQHSIKTMGFPWDFHNSWYFSLIYFLFEFLSSKRSQIITSNNWSPRE